MKPVNYAFHVYKQAAVKRFHIDDEYDKFWIFSRKHDSIMIIDLQVNQCPYVFVNFIYAEACNTGIQQKYMCS